LAAYEFQENLYMAGYKYMTNIELESMTNL